ncbi:MAG TPA: hypothetical protein VGE74_12475 [Gemmata sp.]
MNLVLGLIALLIGGSYLPGVERWFPVLAGLILAGTLAALVCEVRNEIRWQWWGLP